MVSLMKGLCFSFIILASLATLFSVADARRFYVGGSRGWVMNPRESYNTWAERTRFQVNDTLYFKFAKGSDSVQEVMKADYYGCNIRNPLQKFDNGESEVKLNRSGPFYFISGNQDHCMKGQKLIVVVLAIRHPKKVPISPAKPPSTAQPPKSHSPVSPVAPSKAPSTAQPPKSHSPVSPVAPAKGPSTAEAPKVPVSPPAKAPSTAQPPNAPVSPAQPPQAHSPVSPSKAPSTTQPPKSHAPVSPVAPSKAPSTAESPKAHSPVSPAAPAKAPSTVQPPSAHSPVSPITPANAPSTTQTPDHSPATPAPGNTPPSSTTPPQSTPADNINAPAASTKNAASVVAVTSVMTTVLSVAFTVLMFA
ncbi:Early nodulin-like protein 1 [Hirschfeldia incana]|nr:Early nodulin-like protein 1 [Hirschfeldia incana]